MAPIAPCSPSSGTGYRNTGAVIAQTAAQSQRDDTNATIAKSALVSGCGYDRFDPDCSFCMAGCPELGLLLSIEFLVSLNRLPCIAPTAASKWRPMMKVAERCR